MEFGKGVIKGKGPKIRRGSGSWRETIPRNQKIFDQDRGLTEGRGKKNGGRTPGVPRGRTKKMCPTPTERERSNPPFEKPPPFDGGGPKHPPPNKEKNWGDGGANTRPSKGESGNEHGPQPKTPF